MKERILAEINNRIEWYKEALVLERDPKWRARFEHKRDALESLRLTIEDFK